MRNSAQDAVRRAVEQRDERAHQRVEPVQRARDEERHPLGLDDRVDLRDLLAGGDVQRGHEDVGDRDRQRGGHAVGEAAEDRLDEVGDRRLAQEADAQRGQGDAELARGQVLADVVELAQDAARAGVALGGQLLELRAPRADEGELPGHEEPVGENQDDDRDQQQRGHRTAGWKPLLRGRSSATGRSAREASSHRPCHTLSFDEDRQPRSPCHRAVVRTRTGRRRRRRHARMRLPRRGAPAPARHPRRAPERPELGARSTPPCASAPSAARRSTSSTRRPWPSSSPTSSSPSSCARCARSPTTTSSSRRAHPVPPTRHLARPRDARRGDGRRPHDRPGHRRARRGARPRRAPARADRRRPPRRPRRRAGAGRGARVAATRCSSPGTGRRR